MNNRREALTKAPCKPVCYTRGDPLWQAGKNQDGGHWSERRDGGIVDPGEEQRGFKENTRMMDMKEWLIALGGHTSGADCQTGCRGYSEHSLRPRLLFLNKVCLHTDRLYLHQPPAQAPISSVLL